MIVSLSPSDREDETDFFFKKFLKGTAAAEGSGTKDRRETDLWV